MRIKFIQDFIDRLRRKKYLPSKKDDMYINFDKKPIYENKYQVKEDVFYENKVLTLIIQGPIRYEDDFTLETVKIYKRTFKNCPIILSTWKNEKEEYLKKFEDLGVIVLRNELPQIKGLWNVNYQIKSTLEGLKKAYEIGSQYVIKTRCDQRFYETNLPQFLFNILKTFPKDKDSENQKQRLVAISFNTFKYRLYDISDMFLFGHIDDVFKYWNNGFEERVEFSECKNYIEYCKALPSEIGFCVRYLESIGHKCTYTLQDSWECYGKYFAIVDASSFRLYWPKYTNDAFRWRDFVGKNPILEELTFKEWLSLYMKDEKQIPEEILNSPLV